ncbi:IS5 family transposase [Nonomuraea sp. NPDC049709]|uniref:IS5 family transposase n=1 Tax=Nonomuraea sp. NPDC049709 TaxID=3154736 RepID=UPI003437742D
MSLEACDGPRRSYPTDLSDREWEVLALLIPAPKLGGRPAVHERRESVNALAYWVRAGCAWRLLPHDLPPWQTVYHYWRIWRIEGRWEQILACLRERDRVGGGRDPTPSAGIIDSQSVRATDRCGLHGYDGGKKVPGVKRHLLVGTLGTVVTACVSPASVNDRDGAVVLLARAGELVRRLKHVWVDQGYGGQEFIGWILDQFGVTLQIVVRRDSGFRHTWARKGSPPQQVSRFSLVPPPMGGGADLRLAGQVSPPGQRLRIPDHHLNSTKSGRAEPRASHARNPPPGGSPR